MRCPALTQDTDNRKPVKHSVLETSKVDIHDILLLGGLCRPLERRPGTDASGSPWGFQVKEEDNKFVEAVMLLSPR